MTTEYRPPYAPPPMHDELEADEDAPQFDPGERELDFNEWDYDDHWGWLEDSDDDFTDSDDEFYTEDAASAV